MHKRTKVIVASLSVVLATVNVSTVSAEELKPADKIVNIETLRPQLQRSWIQLAARISAVESVEIRPQVSGRIEEILFVEGSRVEQGQLLMVIDPRPFLAAVASNEAALASAQAAAEMRSSELKRASELLASKGISRSTFDARRSEATIAQANVAAAEAALSRSKLELDYAHIRAPVSGYIGRAEITRGNVINSGGAAPVLTRIVSSDRVYAELELAERDYLNIRQRGNAFENMPVELRLQADGRVYLGVVHAFDNSVNSRTGTIRVRAIFDNQDATLLPGLYAQVRLGSASVEPVLLVSQLAVGTDQDKKFVYLVDSDQKIAYRQVRLGRSIDGYRRVESGLSAGDRVVINGIQKVYPDMHVMPQELVEKPLAKTALLAVDSASNLAQGDVAVEY